MAHLLFFLFLITVSVNIMPEVHSKCIADQQQSLLHFKNSLLFDSSSSSKLISWNSSTDCCSWLGVTCSNGRVIGLEISGESFSCSIDNLSSLFHLQHLQSINLANNDFNGSQIPSAIGKLTELRYLNLSSNNFSGEIPVEISQLSRLVVLDISEIYYIGQLKLENLNLSMLVQNLTELKELYLDGVIISAQGSDWCQAISSSLPNLRVLSLSDCDLSGSIHESLAKIQSLSTIILDYNNILAPVPGFIANFSNLTSLSLRDCGLHGVFPKEIFQVHSLQSIDLAENPKLHGSFPEFPKNGSLQSLILADTNFSGVLPESIGNLKMLSKIDISDCNFTGSIPSSITNLTQLVSLSMSTNQFTGSFPSFSRAYNLVKIDLTYNALTGHINSTRWENLTNLLHLDLRNNMLEGNIPSSLFSLPLLRDLQLTNNQFSGQLTEISNVSSYSLVTLDLSSNNLEGTIPVSIFSFRGLRSLALNSNNFTGSFHLNDLHQLKNLSDLELSHNSLFISHDATNFSYHPQFSSIMLASGKLRVFPDFLRNQSSLQFLDLAENELHGKIPNWIWKLNSLELLNLSCNSLETLEVPFLNLTSLAWLDLHSNQLQGEFPKFSTPAIYYLDYSRNNFSSSIPNDIGIFSGNPTFFSAASNNLHGIIPGSFCSQNLEVLDLSNNSLTGMIPQCLTTMTTLAVLNLRRNDLTDSIADKIPQDCSLRSLDLSGNQIQGQLPQSLVNCIKLEVLDLGYNQITDTFPCFLKNISTLHVLVLRSNNFYGQIACPKINGTWPVLQIIDLAHNSFDGVIPGTSLTTWQAMIANKDDTPTKINHLQFRDKYDDNLYYQDAITITSKGLELELVKVLTIFTAVDFSCNKFDGAIPEEIGEFKLLHVLNLSNNAFMGAIPSSLSHLQQLESLDLSQNNLSGQIPPEFAKLTFLSFLNLSNNQLYGRIPTSTQFSTFPKASFEGNKGLWGPPLTVLSPPPPTSNGVYPNFGDEIDWDLIIFEIGCTFGFGIAVGSLLFCKRWRKWYYRVMFNILFKIFPQLEHRFGNHRRHVYINQRYWRR